MISETLIESKIKSIRNLKQYKTFTETDLRKKAVSLLQEYGDDLEVEGMFTNRKEKKAARSLTKKYLQYFTPQNISDQNNLKHLIFLEIVQVRLQVLLNEANDELGGAVGLKTLEAHNKNLKEIADMKQRLGLIQDKKKDKDSLDKWKLLQKKAKVWRNENQASRTLVCPKCAGMTLLKIRTDIYDAQEHPYFQDRLLYNKRLVELYLDKKITDKDLALILNISTDYVGWLIKKWHTNPHCQDYEKESGEV